MNIGYSNRGIHNDAVCPLCGSDVYISKYGNDYKCMNEECLLYENAWTVITKIGSILKYDENYTENLSSYKKEV